MPDDVQLKIGATNASLLEQLNKAETALNEFAKTTEDTIRDFDPLFADTFKPLQEAVGKLKGSVAELGNLLVKPAKTAGEQYKKLSDQLLNIKTDFGAVSTEVQNLSKRWSENLTTAFEVAKKLSGFNAAMVDYNKQLKISVDLEQKRLDINRELNKELSKRAIETDTIDERIKTLKKDIGALETPAGTAPDYFGEKFGVAGAYPRFFAKLAGYDPREQQAQQEEDRKKQADLLRQELQALIKQQTKQNQKTGPENTEAVKNLDKTMKKLAEMPPGGLAP